MIVKLLTEHHFEFLSLKGGCRGSSESTLVKMSNCWNSHDAAQILSDHFQLFVYCFCKQSVHRPCPEVIKLFPCSTQLSTKFIQLINVKMPTTVVILTFISMINTTAASLKPETSSFVGILVL